MIRRARTAVAPPASNPASPRSTGPEPWLGPPRAPPPREGLRLQLRSRDIEASYEQYQEWRKRHRHHPQPSVRGDGPASSPESPDPSELPSASTSWGRVPESLLTVLPAPLRQWLSQITQKVRVLARHVNKLDLALVPPSPDDDSKSTGGVEDQNSAAEGPLGGGSKVMRVNQLDAATLDDDLHRLLWSGLERLTRHRGQHFVQAWRAELKAIIKLGVFMNTIWKQQPTPGMQLQNLMLVGNGARRTNMLGAGQPRFLTRRQRVLFGAMNILAPWLLQRAKAHMSEYQWIGFGARSPRRVLYEIVNIMEQFWDAVSILHFLVFLSGGSYRSLVERLLRIKVAYVNPRAHRALSFEFMNQYLVWRTVARFLLFVIPLIDFGALARSLMKAVGMNTRRGRRHGDTLGGEERCAVCDSSPITLPVSAIPCGHFFCYTCVRSLRMERPTPPCPVAGCGVKITGERRLMYASGTQGVSGAKGNDRSGSRDHSGDSSGGGRGNEGGGGGSSRNSMHDSKSANKVPWRRRKRSTKRSKGRDAKSQLEPHSQESKKTEQQMSVTNTGELENEMIIKNGDGSIVFHEFDKEFVDNDDEVDEE